MNPTRMVRLSKFLSRHLRHAPEELGLVLAPGGWVAVTDLLQACQRAGVCLSKEELEKIVQNNDKQRFSFNESRTQIRANQGHSVEVDLQLSPALPPEVLYHGTSEDVVQEILRTGLSRMRRHHVHLSTTEATARKVGSRHGKPVIFVVAAQKMHEDGKTFYCSTNGVWLVDEVPPQYLRLLSAANQEMSP